MAYVYRHIRLDKNEPFYIGVGGLHKFDKYKRSRQKSDKRAIWKRIVAKTDYETEILLDDLTFEEALEKEKEFIKLYGRKNNGTGILANLTDGGEGTVGYIPTNEARSKLSKVWKGRKQTSEHIKNRTSSLIGVKRSDSVIEGMKKRRKGISLSENHRINISKATKGDKNPFYGKHHTEETIKKLSRPVIDTSTNIVYISIRSAANSLNLSYDLLKMQLRGVRKNKTTLIYYNNGN